ncbi:MAG: CBS domain-containing protein [Reyranellaceae bacterium]
MTSIKGGRGRTLYLLQIDDTRSLMRKLSDVVLLQQPLILNETASVMAACERMRDTQAGSVLVAGETGRLAGIFTGRDAVCRVLAEGRDPATTPLGQVMTRDPITLSPEQSAIDALRLMWDGGFRHVPLVKAGRILGVVSRGDFKGLEFSRHEDERDLWEHMR